MKSCWMFLLSGLMSLGVVGCASWYPQTGARHAGSMVEYLYPDAKEAPQMQISVTTLRPPVRVGLAFVPGGQWNTGIPETERLKLLERVKSAFTQYDFIGKIETIPSEYLLVKGGFANLEQISRLFNVDVVVLMSYDQMQFNDSNALSFLYWTVVGAYVVKGDQYDIQTLLDAAVFDVASKKLLFRAPGTSQIKGSASLVGFNEKARQSRIEGYDKAVEALIPNLKSQLEQFKQNLKTDAAYRVENRPGYHGSGAIGIFELGLLFLVGVGALFWRERH